MKVLAIVPSIYDTSPGQRFRIEQWEPILREKGVEITYSPFETEELHRVLYENGQTLKKAKTVLQNMNNRRVERNVAQDFSRFLFSSRKLQTVYKTFTKKFLAASTKRHLFCEVSASPVQK